MIPTAQTIHEFFFKPVGEESAFLDINISREITDMLFSFHNFVPAGIRLYFCISIVPFTSILLKYCQCAITAILLPHTIPYYFLIPCHTTSSSIFLYSQAT